MSESLVPYVGLVPYSEEDEPFFFGRSKERRSVAFNLRGTRLTVMYGPSGVGKSSLLNAGVASDLHKLAERNQLIYKRPELIVVVFNAWHDDPIAALMAEVTKVARQFISHGEILITPSTLAGTIEVWAGRLHSDILIIFDQFEDYFVNAKAAGAEAFAQQFAEVINSPTLRANFLISIREDALSKLDVFKSLIPNLFENYLRIDYLRAKAAHDVIREPIRVYNEKTKARPQYIVEPRLVDAVIKDIVIDGWLKGETGPDSHGRADAASDYDPPIATALLQLVMRKIWDEELAQNSHKLRLGTLERLGNTLKIVTNHLDTQMNALPENEKEVAASIFHYLVTPSGWKIAHTTQDLAGYTNHRAHELEPILLKLTEARILRQVPPPFQSDAGRFEIFHEVLIPAVLGWLSRYNLTKQTEAERARLRDEVTYIERKEKQARARARTNFFLFILFLVLTVVLGMVAAYAWQLARKARTAEVQAQQAEQTSNTILTNMNLLEKELPLMHAVLSGHTQSVVKVLFSPDEKTIVTISDDGTARSWEADTGKGLFVQSLELPLTDIAFNSNGSMVAIAHSDQITLWDPTTGHGTTLGKHPKRVNRVAFDPTDDQYLASADQGGTTIIWNVGSKSAHRTLLGYHAGAINDVAWSPQGVLLVTAGADSTAHIWDGRAGSHYISVRHEGAVNCAVFSPDGKELLTTSEDLTARIWKVVDGTFIRSLKLHSGPVYSAAFGKERIVTASADRTARIWDAHTREDLNVLPAYSEPVRGVRLSRDGTKVITWGGDRTSRVWDASTGRLLHQLVAHIRATNSADFSPNGKLAVTANSDFTARVWDVGGDDFKVKDARLSIEPNSYQCPAIVRLFGRIEVEGAGTVRYRFMIGRRPLGPVRELAFEAPGSKEVGAFYRFNDRVGNTSGSVYLWVLHPDSLKSKSAEFRVHCPNPSREEKLRPEPTP